MNISFQSKKSETYREREIERERKRERETSQEQDGLWWCLLSGETNHSRKRYHLEMEGNSKDKKVGTLKRGSKVCDRLVIHQTKPAALMVGSMV